MAPAGPVPGRRRGDRHPGRARRRRVATPGSTERYCYGPEKVVAIAEVAERDGIDLAASYAYSDSATDVPMLEAVGHAGGREPRPRAAARRQAARLGGAPVHPPGAAARAGADAGAAPRRAGRRGRAGRGGRRAWRLAGCGTRRQPPPPPRRRLGRRRRGRGPRQDQALRTFFVARVASAAITTSSSSFFMAAMVAGAHRVAPVDAVRRPRRLVASVAAWRRRPPVAAAACEQAVGRRSKCRTSCPRHARCCPPTGRKRRGRSAVAPTRPCCSPRRPAWWSDSSVLAIERVTVDGLLDTLADQPLWMQALAPTVGLSIAGAVPALGGAAARRPTTADEYVRSLPRPGATSRSRRGRCSAASWPASPPSATAGRSASRARRSTPGRRSGRPSSAASPGSSPARTPSCCSSPARRRAWPPSSRRRPPARCSPSRCRTGPTWPAATCCRRWWPSAASYVAFAAVDGTDPILPVGGVASFGWRDIGGALVVGVRVRGRRPAVQRRRAVPAGPTRSPTCRW